MMNPSTIHDDFNVLISRKLDKIKKLNFIK